MTLDELKKRLSDIATSTDDTVEQINVSATATQKLIFEYLIEQVDKFEISAGDYVTGQNYAERIAIIERRMNELITKNYTPSVKDYLKHYNTIESQTIQLHADYNNLEVAKSLLNPTKQALLSQGSYYLVQGLADAYVQPAKFLMMQYVTKGSSVNDLRRALIRWDKGTMEAGELASDRHAPRLQAYATQIARDTVFTYQGAMQEVIKSEYGLTKFIYVGGLVSDSRPFCRHLVGLRRKIDLEEVPPLVEAFPEGLKPNTTKKNFLQYRGGYGCRHTVMVVK